MYKTALLLAASSLAAARPLIQERQITSEAGVFHISQFDYTCTAYNCFWAFDVSEDKSSENHPAFSGVHCNGTTESATDFSNPLECTPVGDTNTVSAYVNSTEAILYLQYEVREPAANSMYWYEGSHKVEAGQPTLQAFDVPETEFRSVAKRQTNPQWTPYYDAALNACKKFHDECLAKPYTNATICDNMQMDCFGCVSSEDICRQNGTEPYAKELQCTQEAQKCYFQVENPGTMSAYYGVDEAFATCKNAPLENNSFCASQKSGFEACRDQENECRTASGANQSYCSSQVSGCFSNAVGSSS